MSMPGPGPSVYSPFMRCGMPQGDPPPSPPARAVSGAAPFRCRALHEVRNAAGELHPLQPALDVALGVGDGLAVLAGEAVGELVVVAVGELQEFHYEAGAALRGGGRP